MMEAHSLDTEVKISIQEVLLFPRIRESNLSESYDRRRQLPYILEMES